MDKKSCSNSIDSFSKWCFILVCWLAIGPWVKCPFAHWLKMQSWEHHSGNISQWVSQKSLFIHWTGEESAQPITEEYVEEAQIDTCIKEIEKLETEPLIRESKNKNYDDPLDQIFKPIQKEIKDHLSGRVRTQSFCIMTTTIEKMSKINRKLTHEKIDHLMNFFDQKNIHALFNGKSWKNEA